MRAFLFGLIGGLAALIIVGAVAAFALVVYVRGDAARDRAVLLRQIDDLETFRKGLPSSGSFASEYARRQDSFLIQREYDELRRYRQWWITTKQTEGRRSRWSDARYADPTPADLRDPAMLDRYLKRQP